MSTRNHCFYLNVHSVWSPLSEGSFVGSNKNEQSVCLREKVIFKKTGGRTQEKQTSWASGNTGTRTAARDGETGFTRQVWAWTESALAPLCLLFKISIGKAKI